MNRRISLFLALISIVICNSCNEDNCSVNVGFKLSYHLFENININGSTYCDLVNESFTGKLNSILALSRLKIEGGASYEHGAVLIEIIDKIGEKKYLKIFCQLNQEERKYLYYSIIFAGLDFTENLKYKNKSIDKVFPLLTRSL